MRLPENDANFDMLHVAVLAEIDDHLALKLKEISDLFEDADTNLWIRSNRLMSAYFESTHAKHVLLQSKKTGKKIRPLSEFNTSRKSLESLQSKRKDIRNFEISNGPHQLECLDLTTIAQSFRDIESRMISEENPMALKKIKEIGKKILYLQKKYGPAIIAVAEREQKGLDFIQILLELASLDETVLKDLNSLMNRYNDPEKSLQTKINNVFKHPDRQQHKPVMIQKTRNKDAAYLADRVAVIFGKINQALSKNNWEEELAIPVVSWNELREISQLMRASKPSLQKEYDPDESIKSFGIILSRFLNNHRPNLLELMYIEHEESQINTIAPIPVPQPPIKKPSRKTKLSRKEKAQDLVNVFDITLEYALEILKPVHKNIAEYEKAINTLLTLRTLHNRDLVDAYFREIYRRVKVKNKQVIERAVKQYKENTGESIQLTLPDEISDLGNIPNPIESIPDISPALQERLDNRLPGDNSLAAFMKDSEE